VDKLVERKFSQTTNTLSTGRTIAFSVIIQNLLTLQLIENKREKADIHRMANDYI
jgi:hypothetical protein